MEERTPLADYWRMLLGHRKFIGRFVLIVVGATVAVSLLMTNIYQAKALIAPVTSREGPEGTLSALTRQLGGVPGLAGLPLQGSTSLAELSNLLHSNIVRGKMIEQYNLLPILFPTGGTRRKKSGSGGAWIPAYGWAGFSTGSRTARPCRKG